MVPKIERERTVMPRTTPRVRVIVKPSMVRRCWSSRGSSTLNSLLGSGRVCMLARKGGHDLACEAPECLAGAAAIEDHIRDADTAERVELVGDLIRSAD